MLFKIIHFYGLALIISCAFMVAVWILARIKHKDSVVDIFWSLCIASLASFFCLRNGMNHTSRCCTMAVMAVVWGCRLSFYIFWRSRGKGDDPRYVKLRTSWGPSANLRMFLFFQIQGLAAGFFSIPFIITSLNQSPDSHPLEAAAIGLFLIALWGETAADFQMHRFKSNPQNQGKTCRAGLWNYSRHPNYFFEWLVWCSFALFALPSPGGWIALICPALMYHFLVNVTGIPMAEEQSLKSRGDDYRQYQKTTSKFFPWRKKTIKN